MRHFDNLLEMAVVFGEAVVAVPLELHEALEHIARKIEKDAKDEIGTYQPAVGGFPAWPELADSTKLDRVAQGYTENDPELRSGQLRDDITHEVEGLEAQIGTPESAQTANVMVFQEFGTSRMPARPILGPAGFKNISTIQKLAGAALMTGLVGKSQIHSLLGYDATTTD